MAVWVAWGFRVNGVLDSRYLGYFGSFRGSSFISQPSHTGRGGTIRKCDQFLPNEY